MTTVERLDLTELNMLTSPQAERVLLSVCASVVWAARVAERRPYATPDALYAAADTAIAAMEAGDLDQAMSGHPRIGERAEGEHARSSRREQSAVSSANAVAIAALAEGNTQYEARFGHIYLVCADGRSAQDLLALLRARLENDPGTERDVARAELGRINRIRLSRLLGDVERGSRDERWLAEAITLATDNVAAGGGPFGALVVEGDRVVGRGVNRVTSDNDPTAHAEVMAIRDACSARGDFQLTGTTLYTSCEPCPLCLSASLWARVDRVVYAADRHDAARGGFDDLEFYELFARDRSEWSTEVVGRTVAEATAPFDAWRADMNRVRY